MSLPGERLGDTIGSGGDIGESGVLELDPANEVYDDFALRRPDLVALRGKKGNAAALMSGESKFSFRW